MFENLSDRLERSFKILKGEGKITEIDEEKGKIKVSVNMFGRETPANIDFLQAKKV